MGAAEVVKVIERRLYWQNTTTIHPKKFTFGVHMQFVLKWVVWGILAFHIIALGTSIYYFNIETPNLGIYRFDSLFKLLFTLAWLGIALKKRWCAFAYFLLCLYELAMRLFFRKTQFADVFGDILFPLDLLFIFVLLLAYREHFRSNKPS